MTIKAVATISLSTIRDIASVWCFYCLQSSTAAAPSTPDAATTVAFIKKASKTNTDLSSTWVHTEPTYTTGSTNSLYTLDLTIYTDDTYSYRNVCLSSSYEAAKAAYNKAAQAQSAAESGAKTATNYVTEQGASGQILVHPEGDTKNAVLIGQDVQIIRNGVTVATYSDAVRIGKVDSAHAGISESGMAVYSAGGTDKVAEFGEKVKIGGAENYIELVPNPSSTEDSISLCVNGKYVTLKASGDDVYSSITGKHIEFSIGNLTEAPYNISVDAHSGGTLSVELLGGLAASGRVTSGKESTDIQLTNGASGDVYLHRKGDIASVYITGAKLGAGTVNRTIATLPAGWRPVRQTQIPIDGSAEALLFINTNGTISCRYNSTTQKQIWGRVTYIAWY